MNLRDLAQTQSLWHSHKWGVPSLQQINHRFSTMLQVRRPNGTDLLAKTNPMEFYGCGDLQEDYHRRWTGPPNQLPPNHSPSHILVADSDERYVSPDKGFIVVRRTDPLFQKHIAWIGESEDYLFDLSELARAIVKHGRHDPHRSKVPVEGQPPISRQFRVGIGCIGQAYQNGEPVKVVGTRFIDDLEADETFDAQRVMRTYSNLVLYTNLTLIDAMGLTGDIHIGPDHIRQMGFSAFLAKTLNIDHPHFIIEDTYGVVGVASAPNHDGCTFHDDGMSDWRPGYRKTGAFNCMLIDNAESKVIQLQVSSPAVSIEQYTQGTLT